MGGSAHEHVSKQVSSYGGCGGGIFMTLINQMYHNESTGQASLDVTDW